MRTERAQLLVAATVLVCVIGSVPACRAQDNVLQSFGTGFIVHEQGYVLTNEHVVHRAKTVNVVVRGKDTYPATILSADEDHDLALLKIEADKPLTAIPLGNSAEVKRQQPVLAMGFPFGEDAISSTSGQVVSIRKEGANQLLVTDVLANPGNSGGPMLNDRGEVIGIISSLLIADVGGTPVKAGEIYAIPISFAFPMLAAIPDFDWRAIGTARGTMPFSEVDAAASPGVVQILSDRVEPGTIEGAAGEGETNFSHNALALLTSYLDRMNLNYETDTSGQAPVIELPVKMDNATHRLRIVIDAERQLVYVFLNRYLSAPPNHPRLPKILQRLMEINWDLNVGKMEWDKTDGEVRLSFMFTTENGIGFEAFEAIITTLLQTGDRLWPELHQLTEGEGEG
jgi:hypothetical protein